MVIYFIKIVFEVGLNKIQHVQYVVYLYKKIQLNKHQLFLFHLNQRLIFFFGNHLFRFDGSRYSSWLPSFSIEINHNFPFRLGRARLTGVQLTSMSQSVQQVFPQIPYEIILADLQRTQSIDATIENIIDHRIHIEPQHAQQQHDTSGSEESSYTSTSASSSEAGEPIDTDLL